MGYTNDKLDSGFKRKNMLVWEMYAYLVHMFRLNFKFTLLMEKGKGDEGI